MPNSNRLYSLFRAAVVNAALSLPSFFDRGRGSFPVLPAHLYER